jgi:hypothetical protein
MYEQNDDLRRRYCPGVVRGVCAYLYVPQVTKVNVNLEEVLSNMRTVRHFAMETHEAERYAKHLSSTKGSLLIFSFLLFFCYFIFL